MNSFLSIVVGALCIGIFIPWIPKWKRRHHLIAAFLLISFTAIFFPVKDKTSIQTYSISKETK